MEDLNNILKSKFISEEQKELILFKEFYNSLIKTDTFPGLENISNVNKVINFKNILFAYKHSFFTYLSMEDTIKFEKFLENFLDVRQNYENILSKSVLLADELNLSNSLEYSNLFSYLLWNGYFSKNCLLTYDSKDRMMLGNNFSYDVMNGKGVCLNFSCLLRDFLNKGDYESSVLICSLVEKIKKNYKTNLKRQTSTKENCNTLLDKLLEPFIKKIGNHAFVLINDAERLYIYDPTNLLIANIIDNNTASVVEGDGKFKLKPWTSYDVSNYDISNPLLDKLIITKKFNYDDSLNFSKTWNKNLNYFQSNKIIFKDFHEEIKNDIKVIADISYTIQKIKKEFSHKK